jgi:dolichyl-phosphate-mannose--protein O-mannosyl transferase
MSNLRLFFSRAVRWEYIPLILLVLMVSVLHISWASQARYLFLDENYYIPNARSILHGGGSYLTEHPPLAQLLITSSIFTFGDTQLGARFISIVFGLAGIVFFYLICRRLNLSSGLSYFATILFSIDNLSFYMSSIAMFDVFMVTFILASFWAYLKGWYARAGLFIGLACLCKLVGIVALLAILIHWIFSQKRDKRIAAAIIILAATFFAMLPLLDFIIEHKFVNPIGQVLTMLADAQRLTFENNSVGIMATRPWDWLIYINSGIAVLHDYLQSEYLMISPFIWALTIPSMIIVLFRRLSVFTLGWFAAAYLAWIPLVIITDRLSYIFYFYPAIGAVCIGIALMMEYLSNMKSKLLRLIKPSFLLMSLVVFIVMNPAGMSLKIGFAVIIFGVYLYIYEIKRGVSSPLSTHTLPTREGYVKSSAYIRCLDILPLFTKYGPKRTVSFLAFFCFCLLKAIS